MKLIIVWACIQHAVYVRSATLYITGPDERQVEFGDGTTSFAIISGGERSINSTVAVNAPDFVTMPGTSVNQMMTLIREQQATINAQQVQIDALKQFVGMMPPPPMTPPPPISPASLQHFDFSDLSSSPSADDWQLALNIDTSDGNIVSYCNTDFWTSSSALGGATSNTTEALTRDFKDTSAFSTTITKLLIVVHEQGGVVPLGWRQWTLLKQRTLAAWFSLPRGEWETNPVANMMASSSTGGAYKSTLNESEPMVRNTVTKHPSGTYDGPHTDELWVNHNSGDVDYNRLGTRKAADTTDWNNLGWGLGTVYDTRSDIGGDGCTGSRPLCDAQMHTTKWHWGSEGGIGGMIGSDHTCKDGCPWTISSGYNYDYAIYVSPSPPPSFIGCFEPTENLAGWPNHSCSPGSQTFYLTCGRLSGSFESLLSQCRQGCSPLSNGYTHFAIHDGNACLCGITPPTGTPTSREAADCVATAGNAMFTFV